MRMTTILCALVLGSALAIRAAAGDVNLEIGETITLEVEDVTLREAVLAIGEAVPLTLVERSGALEGCSRVSQPAAAATIETLYRAARHAAETFIT